MQEEKEKDGEIVLRRFFNRACFSRSLINSRNKITWKHCYGRMLQREVYRTIITRRRHILIKATYRRTETPRRHISIKATYENLQVTTMYATEVHVKQIIMENTKYNPRDARSIAQLKMSAVVRAE